MPANKVYTCLNFLFVYSINTGSANRTEIEFEFPKHCWQKGKT